MNQSTERGRGEQFTDESEAVSPDNKSTEKEQNTQSIKGDDSTTNKQVLRSSEFEYMKGFNEATKAYMDQQNESKSHIKGTS